MKKPDGRNVRRGTDDPAKPGYPTDMTKAVRVAQGGAESHPIQGIGRQFRTIPTIYRPSENRRPGKA
jgi:hypothetical protein